MPQHGPYRNPVVEFAGWAVWTAARPMRSAVEYTAAGMRDWQNTCGAWLEEWQPGSTVFLNRHTVRLSRWPVPAALAVAGCLAALAWLVRP